jgi:glycosyltransferase involved in cell wall biosynthesis
MMLHVVQALSHSVESYDMLKLYKRIGVEAFDIGPYIDPQHPHVDTRPPSDMTFFPDLKGAVDAIGSDDNLTAAQEHLPDALLDWADVIVFHHYLERLVGDWPRIRDWMRGAPGRRVIWRTVGQSVENNERMMGPLRADGLERVAYSPNERFIPGYIGHDALIRFGKDPTDWYGWTGDKAVVGNVTQGLLRRDPWTNYGFWEEVTRGLPRLPAGPGSELHGGLGELGYDEMRQYLRDIRVYLYTGTQPASYTLGLIEAMMTGVPVVSIGPGYMQIFGYPELFEGHELAVHWAPTPDGAAYMLDQVLTTDIGQSWSALQREMAVRTFGLDTIADQWALFLGVTVHA